MLCIIVLSGPAVELHIVQAEYTTSIVTIACPVSRRVQQTLSLALHCHITHVSLQLSSSVTCSLSLFLGCRAVPVPRVVLSKNLAFKLCPPDFSPSRTARLRDVVWSRLCRIQHGVRAVGFVLSIKIQSPPSDARHRVESAASPPCAARGVLCLASK